MRSKAICCKHINVYIFLFAIAIGMGTAIIVGRFVGGNEQDEAYTSVWTSVKWAFLFYVMYGDARDHIPLSIDGAVYG